MYINTDAFSNDLIKLIEIVGEDAFIKLCEDIGGALHYIPTYDSICKANRNVEIVKKYDGKNLRELASEYKLSTNHIKRIINENN